MTSLPTSILLRLFADCSHLLVSSGVVFALLYCNRYAKPMNALNGLISITYDLSKNCRIRFLVDQSK